MPVELRSSVELKSPLPVIALLALTGCGGESTSPFGESSGEVACTIDVAELQDGGVSRDGIPALTNPTFVPPGDPSVGYLLPTDRVIGLRFANKTLAIPHNILWWHEIMNLDFPDAKIAVTYCPLTGTAMAFDRAPLGGAELGVSGLLFRNNQVMFDRSGVETLFPQIMGEGVCGLRKGTRLPRISVAEMTWEAWQEQFPQTQVVSGSTGFNRDYTRYPYGEYERIDEPPFLPQQYDTSRQPKERIVGIEGPSGGFLAVPFLELDALGEFGVVNLELDGIPLAIVWDRAGQSGTTFSRIPLDVVTGGDDPLTFSVENGKIIDLETGSEWSLAGRAIDGPLGGASLRIHPASMIAFWFAWSAFHPNTEVWTR
jgi:uncharacterized protein DUF3179